MTNMLPVCRYTLEVDRDGAEVYFQCAPVGGDILFADSDVVYTHLVGELGGSRRLRVVGWDYGNVKSVARSERIGIIDVGFWPDWSVTDYDTIYESLVGMD